jgi:hypothetical protein
MRTGITVEITPADRVSLEAIIANRNGPQKHVWRSQIVLLTSEGIGTNEIMRRTGKTPSTATSTNTTLSRNPSLDRRSGQNHRGRQARASNVRFDPLATSGPPPIADSAPPARIERIETAAASETAPDGPQR